MTPRAHGRSVKIIYQNPLVFDHAQILRDYFAFKRTGQRPKP